MYMPTKSEDLEAILILVFFGSFGILTSLFCLYKKVLMVRQTDVTSLPI